MIIIPQLFVKNKNLFIEMSMSIGLPNSLSLHPKQSGVAGDALRSPQWHENNYYFSNLKEQKVKFGILEMRVRHRRDDNPVSYIAKQPPRYWKHGSLLSPMNMILCTSIYVSRCENRCLCKSDQSKKQGLEVTTDGVGFYPHAVVTQKPQLCKKS